MSEPDAVVVGAGPNGLAAAVTLAQAGLAVTVLEAAERIGGGARSGELILPGVVHDVCSAVHPFGVSSPFFDSLDLARHGLTWRWADVDLAHPLDGGRAGAMLRSIDATARGLGADGRAWRRLFGPITDTFENVAQEVLEPLLHLPRHPLELARFGLWASLPATVTARRWRTEEARALFAGTAAHLFQPLDRPLSSAVGVIMVAAGHHRGWPVAEGGSQAITRALASMLGELGGTIETGVRVTSLPSSPLVLLDVAPAAAADIIGERLPDRVRRAYRAWRHGPAAFKVDLVVDGGVPWDNEACRRAGTVHCGGTLEEIALAERDVWEGRMPARPFVLVAQQYLADPGRSKGDLHPVWAYAHVPHAYNGDATEAVVSQIERFAPGFRDRIVGTAVRRPADIERENPNFVGGDISTGSNNPLQVAFRPLVTRHPYATGVPGVFLCSAATPPGAGVHGMCGYGAARAALRTVS
ncbi:MAG TPA: NAD(P)/FAD-dependent oxidoreductase [Acidimicrobiales bacterium]